ncbi:MAG: EAL domain-containing protein, partial [Erysipelotrichaceae bacterium]|nr:EAL domain-containing protein [Erysipelotrichaceae bacterium]
IKLDNYIFENLCQIIARWKENNIKVMPVSFNISRVHLNDENFVNDLVDIKNRYNIDDGILEIELTESIFIDFDRLDVLKDALCKLHDNGFMCSLDDFGCGYSSLSLLRSFDIDIIKLDKVFFKDLSEKSKKIISALIALAKSIGVLTVAEGIETNKQYEFLKMANCDLIQGYLFSRPLSVDDFEKWCVDYHPKEDENA